MSSVITAILFSFLVASCSFQALKTKAASSAGWWRSIPERKYEGTVIDSFAERIGYGFRKVSVSVPSKSTFEAIAHYTHLYHHRQLLGDSGNYSISPSGRYAVYHYQENLELFDRRSASIAVVGMGFTTLARFKWSPDESILTIYDPHHAKTLALLTATGESGRRRVLTSAPHTTGHTGP